MFELVFVHHLGGVGEGCEVVDYLDLREVGGRGYLASVNAQVGVRELDRSILHGSGGGKAGSVRLQTSLVCLLDELFQVVDEAVLAPGFSLLVEQYLAVLDHGEVVVRTSYIAAD